ncbi:TolC family protein [Luteibaculum oceani]|uniref:TolC family protein n=1 Tax=Luteibaculum oceani TaxID=1294296 RepID=A0A5C6UV93_9FLAO|nr:TolC family protein [Luteibaculum oceani]TXC76076.1 TolC family protein [Luteibaculum oceani]
MMRSLLPFVLILFTITSPILGQSSTTELGYQDFIERVFEHHPEAVVANLIETRALAKLSESRGNFDPQFFIDISEKKFDQKDYYGLREMGLVVPTVLGLKFDAGLERNRGVFLNPENSTPSDGLYYAGVSLPILQGLITDKRRTALAKAKALAQVGEAEKDLALATLHYNASNAYYNWCAAYLKLNIYKDALFAARTRYNAVVNSYYLGDKPAIDTVEAGIQVANRQVDLNNQIIKLFKAKNDLETYLWQNGYLPLELDSNTIPRVRDFYARDFDSKLDSLQFPLLRALKGEIAATKTELRWAREQIKPTLNLKYQVLNSASLQPNELRYQGLDNNYKWGLEFTFPILIREARGKSRFYAAKTESLERKYQSKEREIENKVEVNIQALEILKQQQKLVDRNVANYNELLGAERTLFQNGESSLFLVNAREQGWLKSQIDRIDNVLKTANSELELGLIYGYYKN